LRNLPIRVPSASRDFAVRRGLPGREGKGNGWWQREHRGNPLKRSLARLCGWSIGLFALLLLPAIAVAIDELPTAPGSNPGWIATGPDGDQFSEIESDASADGLDTPLSLDGNVLAIAPILLALGLAWRYWQWKQHRHQGRGGRDPPPLCVDAFNARERPVAASHGAPELVRSHLSSAFPWLNRRFIAVSRESQPQGGSAHRARGHGRSDPWIAAEGGLQQ
jgi:hypothetical protein